MGCGVVCVWACALCEGVRVCVCGVCVYMWGGGGGGGIVIKSLTMNQSNNKSYIFVSSLVVVHSPQSWSHCLQSQQLYRENT